MHELRFVFMALEGATSAKSTEPVTNEKPDLVNYPRLREQRMTWILLKPQTPALTQGKSCKESLHPTTISKYLGLHSSRKFGRVAI